MDISSIVDTATLASRAGLENQPAGQAGHIFETMLFELLLKESGLSNSLGTGAGNEWAILGDHFIQMLASQLAQEVDFGTGRQLTAEK